MKTLILLILSVFLSKGCNTDNQNDLKDTILDYTANTRGFYTNIIVQNQTVTVFKDRNDKSKSISKKISDQNWKTLVIEFQKTNLDKLADYKGVEEKRFYDGAAAGSLKITFKNKLYESQTFDHGKPPLEIEKLVKTILLVSTKD